MDTLDKGVVGSSEEHGLEQAGHVLKCVKDVLTMS